MTVRINANSYVKYVLLALLILGLIFIAGRVFIIPYLDRKFNPVIHMPPYPISEKTARFYESLEFIADLHSDTLLWKRDINQRNEFGHLDIPRMLDANLALQVFTIVNKVPENLNFEHNDDKSDQLTLPFIIQGRPISSWFNLTQRVVAQSKNLHKFAAESKGRLRIIKSKLSLNRYLNDRQKNSTLTAGILGIEGAQALAGNMANLDVVYEAGIRMIGLTHFFDNQVGGSAHGTEKKGLTKFGRQLVKAMEDKHILVDLSHASPNLIDDVLSMAEKPILVSHSGVKGTCNNTRNLSDEHLIKISKNGGVIGIAMFEKAICGKSASAIANAIKYTSDLIGSKHVALGSDFDGAVTSVFDVTGLPLIVDELSKLGMSKTEIRLIMGGNVKRIFLANLP